ncbi:MAG: ATP-dependent DNA helicase RecG [Nitriliruptoraceae bacterium]
MTVQLDDPVTAVTGVGPAVAGHLASAFQITRVRDLLAHYPRRYQDTGEISGAADVAPGTPVTLVGEILDWEVRRVRRRGGGRPMDLATASVRQSAGTTFTATFFNQRWRPGQLPAGTVAAFSGTAGEFRGTVQLPSPDVTVLAPPGAGVDVDEAASRIDRRLVAQYPAVDALASHRIADLVRRALDALDPIEDWLTDDIRRDEGLIDLDTAVRAIHLPDDDQTLRDARRRLVFDELFSLQLGVQARRARLEADAVGVINAPVSDGRAAQLLRALPFDATAAQLRAFGEIGSDLSATRPMHRLLQGDVGSGKTLVAVWSMLCAVDNRRQAALMVPTEVLAEQHHRTLTDLLAPLGVNVLDGIRVDLLTSSTPMSARRRILGELLSGDLDLVVGTHALLEEGVRFADLGVVVIDEQHRFGVAQRVRLKEKAASPGSQAVPDVLVMTATPIPRSLAMTVYGDLDVTVLDELPEGRQPVVTQLITQDRPERRSALYTFIREQAHEGLGTYVVCPFVDPSDEIPGAAATVEHERLAREVFPELEVELVHGRMRPADKDAAMQRFRSGEAHVLVATTVIEVGVDVPHATIMVIEDAERFGISQLHQLRGRVGRGADRSYCVLFAGWRGDLTEDAIQRLQSVEATSDGFELAEVDLRQRGAGQLFGQRQSGVPDLRLADLHRDRRLLSSTRDRARAIVAEDPGLDDPRHRTLRDEMQRRFDGLDALEALETG